MINHKLSNQTKLIVIGVMIISLALAFYIDYSIFILDYSILIKIENIIIFYIYNSLTIMLNYLALLILIYNRKKTPSLNSKS